MVRAEYTVTGMTCAHCIAAVRDEVLGLDGVTDVDLDLTAGSLIVVSAAPIPADAVLAAVDEAGYTAVAH
ncbi:heavy-metal-associated domain-containing protein [Skermania piniformis]|uniref:Heavy-metal-associated domain-containing protein n=1 Tax=Skermania pinensis TaxID=39122 RepID=A0ABX8S9E6_9ACTN|nr:heavy metal-associated domain-containing protein [Skermania piniformis]QXQ13110.1 heavy-metal-associated domain-containing protein [Skermania piniformis]